MLCAGTYLAAAGHPIFVYRLGGRPLPRGVEGPWAWPRHRRLSHLAPRARAALTVTPAWGLTAAPELPGPLGRAGPWSEEVAAIESAYGSEHVAHVSLEEFARTLPSRRENLERFREGGVRSRELARRLAIARRAGETEVHRRGFRQFRAFGRENVLHLFAGLRYEPTFAREHPEAVQTGPLWPAALTPRSRQGIVRARRGRGRQRRWVWYASPASSLDIAPEVLRGLRALEPTPRLSIRTPRPWPNFSDTLASVGVEPVPASRWRREFCSAELRIVTGSRTLLEALRWGGPFLYFNGVLGRGVRRRRHRPEKLIQLLSVAAESYWPPDLRRDLAAFSRAERVAAVVERAGRRLGGWRAFPRAPRPSGFARGFEDAGRVIVRFAGELGSGTRTSGPLVAETRRRSHP